MKIYNYDKNNGLFLGESIAQKNPKREGEYLFPPNSTTIIPPAIKEFEALIFENNKWNIVPDYRGLEQININTHEVSYVFHLGKLEKDYMLYDEYIKSDFYRNYMSEQAKNSKKEELLSQLKYLDEKRIRAICEPSVKDETTGQSWLEYYNSLIIQLRQELEEVQNVD